MKKKIFSLFVAMILGVMPVMVDAATYKASVFGSEDASMSKTTLNGASIKCPKDSTGKIASCYIGVKVTSGTVTDLTVTAELTNMTYDAYEDMGSWTIKNTPVQSGNTIVFNFTSKTGTTAGNQVLLAKIDYTVNNIAEDCSLKITSVDGGSVDPEVPSGCSTSGGKYYCTEGVECTKEEYEAKCVPENPQTGSFIPYVVVLAGLGIAGALYLTTRKKAKIYNV